jgi:hypothetical protein
MKVGITFKGKTIICVKVNKAGCSMWSMEPGPHDDWVSIDAAGVRVRRPTSDRGYPLLWVDRGWRGTIIGIEGINLEEG